MFFFCTWYEIYALMESVERFYNLHITSFSFPFQRSFSFELSRTSVSVITTNTHTHKNRCCLDPIIKAADGMQLMVWCLSSL